MANECEEEDTKAIFRSYLAMTSPANDNMGIVSGALDKNMEQSPKRQKVYAGNCSAIDSDYEHDYSSDDDDDDEEEEVEDEIGDPALEEKTRRLESILAELSNRNNELEQRVKTLESQQNELREQAITTEKQHRSSWKFNTPPKISAFFVQLWFLTCATASFGKTSQNITDKSFRFYRSSLDLTSLRKLYGMMNSLQKSYLAMKLREEDLLLILFAFLVRQEKVAELIPKDVIASGDSSMRGKKRHRD
eukprot:jgi/Bigna1/86018/estExt_fgenesh1_pg.C_70272